ncbi:MAG: sigma 54-interacting transcriptional regulator [Deltaproteobacteria bacterium]|nr:sigma 54-interacting transcriptional regulator [Deltaproteobacteria bacterium]
MSASELVILRAEKKLLQLRVDRAEVCIGSNPTNDVVLPDPEVPEVAAVLIDMGAQRFRLRALDPDHVKVDGAPLSDDERDLADGEAIQIGPYSLTLQTRSDARRQAGGNTRLFTNADTTDPQARLRYDGTVHELDARRPFNIGVHEDNDLSLADPFASSFHCRISYQRGRWFLADLESTNGTLVNGLRVREAELPTQATVTVGRAVLHFEGPTPEPEAETDGSKSEQFRGMIGHSPAMRRVFQLVRRLAGAREPVLVIGESGSGKELVARALHEESARVKKPYLALNCGALTHTLIESELFGHVKGTFTGATHDKPGAFEAAHGGTLFLDEIGELPLDLQPKLLRVLESSTVRRVGGTQEIPVDTRIVAATHRNLEALVQDGQFREDLFHRLFVLSIRIPPLAERPEDVLPLARHFLAGAPRTVTLHDSAETALLDYTWPGNVRELRNVLVRALLMTDGDVIRAEDLEFSRDAFTARSQDARRSVREHDEAERQQILDALDRTNGNRSEAARLLGVSKSTFHDRVKRYGIPARYGQ